MICVFVIFGKQPSCFRVKYRRTEDAKTNRKKAADQGPTLVAMIFPATKVPPQKNAVKNSLK